MRAIERRCAAFVPAAVLLGLLSSAFEGIGIGMLIPLLAYMSGSHGGTGLPWIAGRVVTIVETVMPGYPILGLLGIVMMLVLLKLVTQIANATLMAHVQGRAGDDLRRALADKVLRLDYKFYLSHDPARLITIFSNEVWKATEAVRVILVGYVATTAAVLFGFFLIITNWRLALLVAAGVGISRLAHFFLQRRMRFLGEAIVQTNQILGEQMIHAVRAIRVIRVFGQERRELAAFNDMSKAVRRSMFVSDVTAARSMPTVELILSVSILVVLFAADQLKVGIPQTAAFLVLLYRAQQPVMTASNAALHLASLHQSIAEVEFLLRAETDMGGAKSPAQGTAGFSDFADSAITFDRVSFIYPRLDDKGASVLNEVDLVLPPRTMVALIGASGSGKSTIINLLCRLVDPSAGRISIGGRDVRGLDVPSWRAAIGLAGQDVDLINGTVAQNIAYGMPDANLDAIEAAARMADADEFIRGLPQGYETPLAAIGFGLSGGQRQRIGVARAVLRRPEILVLDEATNAVDTASESRILQRIAQGRPFGRALVVSHHPNALAYCDFGIVLSAGKVVESGPLRELKWFQQHAHSKNRFSSSEQVLP
ncbi:MAG: ABC transporter ATP-binding protein [Acetobacteraceae bacterium]|nr:ABC transporter ATP-binding protein [Acetobacteraceae bacterium]